MHDKMLKTFPHSDSSAPDVFLCFWSFDLVKELMEDIFKKLFWQNICKMLFLSVCLVFHPAVPCCTHFGWREHLALRHVDAHPAGPCKDTLEFHGLRWFSSKRTSRSGNKKTKCSSWTHEAFEWSTVVKEHSRSVWSSWPPLLPSRGQMFVKAMRTKPAALLLRVVYLYTVVQSRIKAQTLSMFIDRPICTPYILYLKPAGNTYFSIRTDWNEWMFMYSNTVPTVVHLCCTQAWWEPGEAD